MFTEKHILGNPYNGHNLSRTVTGYEVTTVDCSADKSSGWNGTTVNLTPVSAGFQGWSITGATLTGSAFNIVGSDVSVQGSYYTGGGTPFQYSGKLVPYFYGYGLSTLWYSGNIASSNLLQIQNVVTGSTWTETARFYTYASKKYNIMIPYFKINVTNSGEVPTGATVGYDNTNLNFNADILTGGTGTFELIYTPISISKTDAAIGMIQLPGIYFSPTYRPYTGTGTLYFSGEYVQS